MPSTWRALRYWKPIAVFWVLILVTVWLVGRLQPEWKLQINTIGEMKFPILLWTSQRGEAYLLVGGQWSYLSIDDKQKLIVTKDASPPDQSSKTEQKEDFSFLPDRRPQ